jgi:23S rRNA (guanine745-N1)-methyltransferase
VARQGYAAFAVGAAARGDSPAMVAARDAFHAGGHYGRVRDGIVRLIPEGARGLALDIAGGTGHYLAGVLDARPALDGLVIDASAAAARRAARSHPRAAAVTADVWRRLPLRDGCAACAVNAFGPRDGGELARVMAGGGTLVVATARPGHLAELRQALGLLAVGRGKEERLDARLGGFALAERVPVEYRVELGAADLANLVLMGPNAFHRDAGQVRRDAVRLAPAQVSVAVMLSRYRRGGPVRYGTT